MLELPVPTRASGHESTAPATSGGSTHFRQLLEKLPAGAYTCDPDGLITYYNEHAVELWGRVPKLNDPADRFCGSFKLYSAAGEPITHRECWMAKALRERREFDGEEILVERPNGDLRVVLAHANPLIDESGRLTGAVNVLVDVTDRQRDSHAQAMLAAIVESSDDAIISKTLEGRILTWNKGAERLFGYRAEEATGNSITLIIPSDRLYEEEEILSRLRRGEQIDHFETVRRAKDGRLIDISVTISPVRDATGRIVGASKVARDITLRKQAEEALRLADQRKDEFLATLSHELRNPLAPIRNATEVLHAARCDPAAMDWAVDVIERQMQQVTRLVDDLMDVSRITRDKLRLKRQRVELAAVVQAAVETSRPLMAAGGHEFSAVVPLEPIVLDADPARLAQAVSNLLSNAARYTEHGGRVWLTAERQGSDAVITVRDTGIGIPAPMLPRIFEKFAQLDRPLERSEGGLGIGLSLVKALVELHGGTVHAHSGGTGKGSEFIVRLPVVVEAGSPTAADDDKRAVHASGLRILVVDDNRDSTATLSMLLRILGNEVRIANDGVEGFGEADEFRPDVVLLDIGMPKMNGYETARRIRSQPWGKRIVLIALTGWGQERDRQLSREAGFDHHFVKPVDPVVLTKLLASIAQTAATV
jgi:PAS domain S-box-containing protein